MSNEIVKKNNAIIDGNTSVLSLPGEKFLNAIYHTWEREERPKILKIPLADLKDLVGMKDVKNHDFVFDTLKELGKKITIKNFQNSQGKLYSFVDVNFLNYIGHEKNDLNIEVEVSEKAVEVLSYCKNFTPLELAIANKFKSLYGFKTWQLFKRYKTFDNKSSETKNSFKKTIQELNFYYGSEYINMSDLKKCIVRGIKEIEKITKEIIELEIDKKDKSFIFSWDKPKDTVKEIAPADTPALPKPTTQKQSKKQTKTFDDFNTFRAELIKQHNNKEPFINNVTELGWLKTTEFAIKDNLLYSCVGLKHLDKDDALKLWNYMFNNQDKINITKFEEIEILKCIYLNRSFKLTTTNALGGTDSIKVKLIDIKKDNDKYKLIVIDESNLELELKQLFTKDEIDRIGWI